MKTRYILVGGYPHKGENNGINFYQELIKGKTKPVKVLVCLFARPKDDWEKAFLQDKRYFQDNLPKVKIEIKLASEEKFIEELKWCDTVYFRGGDISLVEVMKKYEGWDKVLNGKTVAGSSMGAYMLSTYYYDISTNEIKEGLGLTRTKVIVHWESEQYKVDWDRAYISLLSYKESLQTLKLKEGEYVEYKNVKSHLDVLGSMIFEAKSAYFLWKSLAYSRSTNIVSEELAHKYAKIQSQYIGFFVTSERASLFSFVVNLVSLFDPDRKSYSFHKIDKKMTKEFMVENKTVFDKLIPFRNKFIAHRDITQNTDESKWTIPSVIEMDTFFKKLFKFYNSLTLKHLDATTIFDHSSNDLLRNVDHLFMNLEIGEELRIKRIKQDWTWEKNSKKISDVFRTDDRDI